MGWNIWKQIKKRLFNLNQDYGLYNFLIHAFVLCNCDTAWLLCSISKNCCRGGTSNATIGLGETAELGPGLPPSPVTEADGSRAREVIGPDFDRGKGEKILQAGTSAIFLFWMYQEKYRKQVLLLWWCLTVGPGRECARTVMDRVKQLRRGHYEKGEARWRGDGRRAAVFIWSPKQTRKPVPSNHCKLTVKPFGRRIVSSKRL